MNLVQLYIRKQSLIISMAHMIRHDKKQLYAASFPSIGIRHGTKAMIYQKSQLLINHKILILQNLSAHCTCKTPNILVFDSLYSVPHNAFVVVLHVGIHVWMVLFEIQRSAPIWHGAKSERWRL